MQIVLFLLSLSRATLCATFPAITPVSVALYLLLQPFFSLLFTLVLSYKLERLSRWFTFRENKRSHLILWTKNQRGSGRTWESTKRTIHSKSLDFRMLGSRTHHLSNWKSPDSVTRLLFWFFFSFFL